MQLTATAGFQTITRTQTTLEEQGDTRLKSWAEWTRGDDAGLGYPKIEPYTRLVTPTGSYPAGPMPSDVAETDRAVCVIKQRHDSMLWRAIRQFYLTHDAVTVSMRECCCSRAGYYRLVDRARRKVMELVRAA